MVGIAVNEDPGNGMLVTAIACPEGTEKMFGYGRLSIPTLKKCATCYVVLPAKSYIEGISAAYQRSLEKLFVKEHMYSKAAPDLMAYLLKECSTGVCIPHVSVRRHWTIDVAEELSIHFQAHRTRKESWLP
jgi:hypothetical protein